MPVTRILSALITITWSPTSRNGVYLRFSLPERMRATRDASRPNVWPDASTTYHLRAISCPLGKRVDMLQTPENKNAKKYRSMTPRTYSRWEDKRAGNCMSSEIQEYSMAVQYVNAGRVHTVVH